MPAPTLQDWSALYAAASEFRRLEPWQWMVDDDVFGVKDPVSGQIGYCVIMGNLGEFLGMGVYLGTSALTALKRMHEGEVGPGNLEAMFIQDCLMASFEDRRSQEKEDLQVIKSLGLKFKGATNWPLFRRYEPGYPPWFISGAEARFLTVALQQAKDVATRFMKEPDLLVPPEPHDHFVRVPVAGDQGLGWLDAWLKPAPVEPPVVATEQKLNTVRLEAIREANYPRRGNWEVDFSFMPAPIGDRSHRPYYPYVFLCMDRGSGMILSTAVAKPSEHWGEFQEQFYNAVEGTKTVPEKVFVSRQEMHELLQRIAERLGFALKAVRSLSVLDKARNEMMGFMGGEPLV
jgi:hypothetical protein